MHRRTLMALGLGALTITPFGAGSALAQTPPQAVKISVLFGQPKSAAEFERHYAAVHMPMLRAVAGIQRIELATPVALEPGVAPPFYRITEMWFASMAQMDAVTGTPAWQQIVADVPKFASGGATVLVSVIAAE